MKYLVIVAIAAVSVVSSPVAEARDCKYVKVNTEHGSVYKKVCNGGSYSKDRWRQQKGYR